MKLEELARQTRNRGGEVGLLVSDSVRVIDEQLDRLHTTMSHVVERLDAIASQLASLEARVHEDVE